MTQKKYTPIDDLIKKWQQKQLVSPPSKEVEPIPKKEIEFKEIKEKKVEEEVRPHLIKREETIELPPDIQKLGLKPIPTIDFPQYQNIKLPLSVDRSFKNVYYLWTSYPHFINICLRNFGKS